MTHGHFKSHPNFHHLDGRDLTQAMLLIKGEPAKPEHVLKDVLPWRYSGNQLHPTQKPVEAILPLIRAFSQPGALVLDPFAGSATTLVAARQLGRRAVGIEKDLKYYEIARQRLAQGS